MLQFLLSSFYLRPYLSTCTHHAATFKLMTQGDLIPQKPGTYRGTLKEQIRHGQGKYVYKNSFYTYEGEWVDGLKHGEGRLSMKNGGYYKGDFQRGEIRGKGERSWINGDFYRGEFEGGELHGDGVMVYGDGSRYEGFWVYNRYEGMGILTLKNGDLYTGEFHRHKRHGEGKQIWKEKGSEYEGGWVAGKPHGSGIMKYKDGGKYEGQFSHGLRQGQGTYTHIKGITYSGLWINDDIPPEELPQHMVVVGATELEIYQGEGLDLEIAILHTNGDVMEGETGRQIMITGGFLIPPDNPPKSFSDDHEKFNSPFGDAVVIPLGFKPDFDGLSETPSAATATDTSSKVVTDANSPICDEEGEKQGMEYVALPTPEPIDMVKSSKCGHVNWSRVTIPPFNLNKRAYSTGCETLDQLTDDDDVANPEDTKQKGKKKGTKTSPMNTKSTNKDRVGSAEGRDKWKMSGMRAEREKDLQKYGPPGNYVIRLEDVTEPPFFEQRLSPVYVRVIVNRVKHSSTKFFIPKRTSVVTTTDKK